jgi:hypothetical protein
MVEIARRSFITGLIAMVAAPAIVRAGSLMPVKAMPSVDDIHALLEARINDCVKIMARNLSETLYGDLPGRAFNAGLSGLITVQDAAPWRLKQMVSGISFRG